MWKYENSECKESGKEENPNQEFYSKMIRKRKIETFEARVGHGGFEVRERTNEITIIFAQFYRSDCHINQKKLSNLRALPLCSLSGTPYDCGVGGSPNDCRVPYRVLRPWTLSRSPHILPDHSTISIFDTFKCVNLVHLLRMADAVTEKARILLDKSS